MSAVESTNELVRSLLDDIDREAAIRRSARLHSAETIAPDFTPFEFIIAKETTLSKILRWLLDPKASHAQGARFLRLFFEKFELEEVADFECASAACEVATHSLEKSQRRIDVAVQCGNFVLGIENKPYSGFQERQVEDYVRHLANTSSGGFALVILKGWRNQEKAATYDALATEEGRIIDSDYFHVVEWLDACIAACSAVRVAEFLTDLKQNLQHHVLGMPSMDDQKLIISMADTPARKLAALDLISASDWLYDDLHRSLINALRRVCPSEWKINDDWLPRGGRRSAARYITVDFGSAFPVVGFFDIYHGATAAVAGIIRKHDRTRNAGKMEKLWRHLDAALFVGDGGNNHWVWYDQQSELIEGGALELPDGNIWKMIVEPEKVAPAIAALLGRLRDEIRAVLL